MKRTTTAKPDSHGTWRGFAEAVEVGDVTCDVGAGEEGDGGDDAKAIFVGEGGEVGVDLGEVEGEEGGVGG